MQAVIADSMLAAGSMFFVFLYMAFHTNSLFLSFAGLIAIILAVPGAYVVFSFAAKSQEISIAFFLSLFLVVGFGSDVVFVYTDFFKASIEECKPMADRVIFTYRYGGK